MVTKRILATILLISAICYGQISRNPRFASYLRMDTTYVPTGLEPTGTRYWDEAEGTTSLVLTNGTILQDGQELYYPVKNGSGVNIDNGKVAYYDGTDGNSGRLKIDTAKATKDAVIGYFLGVVTEPISNGESGKVTHFGKVRGIQTDGVNYGETWADGDVLYASATIAGGLTNVAPQAPNPAIIIGVVISAHNTNGTIFVRPRFPEKLEDLVDVNGTALANTGQIPIWNNTSKYFDFNARMETALAKTDTSIITGKGIANYTQLVKDSVYNKVDPVFKANSTLTTMRIGDASQTFGSVLRMSGGTSSGSAITFRNYLNIVDSSDATGKISIFSGTGENDGAGLWALGKDHNIRSDTTKRGILEFFTNSQSGTAGLGGAFRWLMYDGTGFKLRYAGTKNGAHTWYDETGAKLGAWETDNYFNSVLGYEINGTSIATTGAVATIAYKGQDNAFTTGQTMTHLFLNNSGAPRYILGTTIAGSDDGAIAIAPNGGSLSTARGAYFALSGANRTSNAGNVYLTTASNAGAKLEIAHKGTTRISILDDSPSDVIITGNIKASGTVTGASSVSSVGASSSVSLIQSATQPQVSITDISTGYQWFMQHRMDVRNQFRIQYYNGASFYSPFMIELDAPSSSIVANSVGVGIRTAYSSITDALTVTGNIKASGTVTGTNHIAGSANYFYFGAEGTDGSWRIGRSGNNLVFERRESGSWVTKSTLTP